MSWDRTPPAFAAGTPPSKAVCPLLEQYFIFVRPFVSPLIAVLLGVFFIFDGLRGYLFAMDSLVGVTMVLGGLVEC